MTSSSQGKRDGRRITVLGIEENAEGTHTLQLDENGMFALPFRQMKMEIKTLLNTRQLPLETLKTFVQLFMQQVIRNIKIHCGKEPI